MEHKTIAELKELNREAGQYFFSQDTMRFFNSHALSNTRAVSDGWLFITSERHDRTRSLRYSLRKMSLTGNVSTIGKFQQYATRKLALAAMRDYQDGDDK